jgi:predicted enzyme related to lactoylglutathione lyase
MSLQFYESLFAVKAHVLSLPNLKMGIFNNNDFGCALCCADYYKPSSTGIILYLNGEPDIHFVLEKVASLGGEIIQPKKLISPTMGYMGLFKDLDGNVLAVKSKL